MEKHYYNKHHQFNIATIESSKPNYLQATLSIPIILSFIYRKSLKRETVLRFWRAIIDALSTVWKFVNHLPKRGFRMWETQRWISDKIHDSQQKLSGSVCHHKVYTREMLQTYWAKLSHALAIAKEFLLYTSDVNYMRIGLLLEDHYTYFQSVWVFIYIDSN